MLRWLREKLNNAFSNKDPEDYPSVVILLKEQQFLASEKALELGQRAWGTHEAVELIGVVNHGASYALRSGKFFFAVNQAGRRYKIKGHERSDLLQRPWSDHMAWLAIDMPTQSSAKLREIDSLGSAYKLLLIYAFLYWSPNCLSVYFPAEGVTVPNLGDLADSINWGRRNGINLDFLGDKK
jgi:hypothetical protein